MAKKKSKIVEMGQPAQSPQMNLDVTKLKNVTCPQCDGIFFDELQMFKEVSAVQSPNGQASMIPIPVVVCNNCGTVHPKFTPKELFEDVANQEG
jgi:hypothetical protein